VILAAASVANSWQPCTYFISVTAPSLELARLEVGHARATAVCSAAAYIESQRRNDNISQNAVDDDKRSEWIVAVTRARSLTLSGRFLRYVPTDRLRPGSDPVISDVSPRPIRMRAVTGGEVTRPESSGPADSRPRR
jgi:hypothetical protein